MLGLMLNRASKTGLLGARIHHSSVMYACYIKSKMWTV